MTIKMFTPDYRVFTHILATDTDHRVVNPDEPEVTKELERSELTKITEVAHESVKKYLKVGYFKLGAYNKAVKVNGKGELGDLRHDMGVIQYILRKNKYLNYNLIDIVRAMADEYLSKKVSRNKVTRYFHITYMVRNNGIENMVRKVLTDTIVDGIIYNEKTLKDLIYEYVDEYIRIYVEPFHNLLLESKQDDVIDEDLIIRNGLIHNYIDTIENVSPEILDYTRLLRVFQSKNTYEGYDKISCTREELTRIDSLRNYNQPVTEEDKYEVIFSKGTPNLKGNVILFNKLPSIKLHVSPRNVVLLGDNDTSVVINNRLKYDSIEDFLTLSRENAIRVLEKEGVPLSVIKYIFGVVSKHYVGVYYDYK